MKFVPRVCHLCRKGKGTLSYRWTQDGGWHRDYFHPKCFPTFLKMIDVEHSEKPDPIRPD